MRHNLSSFCPCQKFRGTVFQLSTLESTSVYTGSLGGIREMISQDSSVLDGL